MDTVLQQSLARGAASRGSVEILPLLWSVRRSGTTSRDDERREFERRMHAAWPGMVRLVERLLAWPGSGSEVEDVVQETFLAAWRGRRSFREEAAWTTWLHTIAIRRARNAARARARRERWFGRTGSEADLDADGVCAPVDAGSNGDGVRDALARLRHRDREVLALRYLEGHAVEDVAVRLGLARAAVDARLSRARRRLAALMDEDGAVR